MATPSFHPSDGHFALLTPTLLLLPSPSAAHVKPYRTLFRKLHADASFCAVAFGEDFEPIVWSDEEVKTFLLERDGSRWGRSGMGDFAVGYLEDGRTSFDDVEGELLKSAKGGGTEEIKIVQGEGFERLKSKFEDENVKWVGYTCARNAITAGGNITDLYEQSPAKAALAKALPPAEEMVEVRYGMDPDFRGRGIATRAAGVVMRWAEERHGVRRFIAETEGENVKSQGLLRKLGFVRSEEALGFVGSDQGDQPVHEVVEWVRRVG